MKTSLIENMRVGLIIIKAGENIKELIGEQLDGGWKEWYRGNETGLSIDSRSYRN